MDQKDNRSSDVPNRQSNMEPAEGSRENVRNSASQNSASQNSASQNSGGITNRPLDREQCEQQQLPERGNTQSER